MTCYFGLARLNSMPVSDRQANGSEYGIFKIRQLQPNRIMNLVFGVRRRVLIKNTKSLQTQLRTINENIYGNVYQSKTQEVKFPSDLGKDTITYF
jgi:hypothetical protein